MRHARAVKAEKLAFLTDIEGVYRDFDDKDSLISGDYGQGSEEASGERDHRRRNAAEAG